MRPTRIECVVLSLCVLLVVRRIGEWINIYWDCNLAGTSLLGSATALCDQLNYGTDTHTRIAIAVDVSVTQCHLVSFHLCERLLIETLISVNNKRRFSEWWKWRAWKWATDYQEWVCLAGRVTINCIQTDSILHALVAIVHLDPSCHGFWSAAALLLVALVRSHVRAFVTLTVEFIHCIWFICALVILFDERANCTVRWLCQRRLVLVRIVLCADLNKTFKCLSSSALSATWELMNELVSVTTRELPFGNPK